MELYPDPARLSSSWTKYDSVKVIPVTIAKRLNEYQSGTLGIDEAVLRNYLGIEKISDPLPDFWNSINDYPEQVGLFSLVAAISTHYLNIRLFAEKYSRGNMLGALLMQEGKHFTNLRSALVESGASDKIFRKRQEIPYDLSNLYKEGAVGKLTQKLLQNRLVKMGYSKQEAEERFIELSQEYQFDKLLSLNSDQFRDWIGGNGISNALYELEKNNITYEKFGTLKALKVKQWLNEWDQIPRFNEKNRKKPQPYFYQFNIPAVLLKRIYEVHSRRAVAGREEEPYSQRKHSAKRSNEIKEYAKGGFPWSTLSEAQRESESYRSLQMPGWLPTSIIANILDVGSVRRDNVIQDDEVIKIRDIDEDFAEILLPKAIWSDRWLPRVPPVEIIDGQHRIKAFASIRELNGNYEFPVIAFHDLDFTWQAYLFYTINIKPKRINTSLAYDLMPLLRIQDWLEHELNGPDIYKKVRAQELTELLWSTEISPWYNRINMLGDVGDDKGGTVSQNAFINSLIASFVKKWEGKIGGLFGGELHEGEQDIIQWDKETQTAYLILIWRAINFAIAKSKAQWVEKLKEEIAKDELLDDKSELQIAFIHPKSFFTTDQGIRPIFYIFNDLSFIANDSLKLHKFYVNIDYDKYSTQDVIVLIYEEFKKNNIINEFVTKVSRIIIDNFDWRTPSAFNPQDPEEDKLRQHQNQFRGSGGYREMRIQLLRILANSSDVISDDGTNIVISEIAKTVLTKLGY